MSCSFFTNGCRSLYVIMDITGYRCSPNEDISMKQLADIRWEQCRWQCQGCNNCTVVTYDAGAMECTLFANTCTNMSKANSDVRTLILDPSPVCCLTWRFHDDPWPDNLVVVNEVGASSADYAVGRLTSGSRMIPARYNLENVFITTYGGQKVDTGTAEYLIVHPKCPVQWVTWTSTSGNDLPAGAIVGGHLENGMPLYIAKAWLFDLVWVIGYYNPETRVGHFWFGAAKDTTVMDILVLLWWINRIGLRRI